MPPPTPAAITAPPPTKTGVYHLLAMTAEEANLQTQRNQYISTTKTTNPSATSMSNTTNTPLNLPPEGVAQGP